MTQQSAQKLNHIYIINYTIPNNELLFYRYPAIFLSSFFDIKETYGLKIHIITQQTVACLLQQVQIINFKLYK